jgi:glycosyltransferase involved in cell wall biosynthesis
MPENKPFISFVIPVYNEEGNLHQLHQQILTAARQLNKEFEIIYVDDGSTDNSERELAKLTPATIITFRTNYGQTAALDAGIHHSNGELIVSLDGDLQNDPADIPKMIDYLQQKDLDVVCGWRKNRKDPWLKKFISDGAKFLRLYLVNDDIHDSGCTLRVYRSQCFNRLHIKGEMHRFIPALLKWRGYKIGEIPVNHRPRTYGKSKYTLKRTFKGFLDMLNLWFWRKYENRPLHMFGSMGIFLMGSSTLLSIYLALLKIFANYALSNKIWPLLAMTGFSTGLQLLVLGLLANLIIENRKEATQYEIKSINQQ